MRDFLCGMLTGWIVGSAGMLVMIALIQGANRLRNGRGADEW